MVKMNYEELIENFKKSYGEEIYSERNRQYQGLGVILKDNDDFEGEIVSLWLPKIEEGNVRKKDLYLISWSNGKNGICELKDLEIKVI